MDNNWNERFGRSSIDSSQKPFVRLQKPVLNPSFLSEIAGASNTANEADEVHEVDEVEEREEKPTSPSFSFSPKSRSPSPASKSPKSPRSPKSPKSPKSKPVQPSPRNSVTQQKSPKSKLKNDLEVDDEDDFIAAKEAEKKILKDRMIQEKIKNYNKHIKSFANKGGARTEIKKKDTLIKPTTPLASSRIEPKNKMPPAAKKESKEEKYEKNSVSNMSTAGSIGAVGTISNMTTIPVGILTLQHNNGKIKEYRYMYQTYLDCGTRWGRISNLYHVSSLEHSSVPETECPILLSYQGFATIRVALSFFMLPSEDKKKLRLLPEHTVTMTQTLTINCLPTYNKKMEPSKTERIVPVINGYSCTITEPCSAFMKEREAKRSDVKRSIFYANNIYFEAEVFPNTAADLLNIKKNLSPQELKQLNLSETFYENIYYMGFRVGYYPAPKDFDIFSPIPTAPSLLAPSGREEDFRIYCCADMNVLCYDI